MQAVFVESTGDCDTDLQADKTRSFTGQAPSEHCPFMADIVSNERVTATDHWQDVRLITFDIGGSNILLVVSC